MTQIPSGISLMREQAKKCCMYLLGTELNFNLKLISSKEFAEMLYIYSRMNPTARSLPNLPYQFWSISKFQSLYAVLHVGRPLSHITKIPYVTACNNCSCLSLTILTWACSSAVAKYLSILDSQSTRAPDCRPVFWDPCCKVFPSIMKQRVTATQKWV